ncbi:MAG: glycosyltransferase [Ignavibacteriales bacterium]|nr:glycosyltransferase [Ignavibacteriales bacterium]
MKVLQITVRADFGGGPEHLYRLMQHLPAKIKCCIASPDEFPYWNRFLSLCGKDNAIVIPHRKFTIGHLFSLYRFVKKHNVNLLHAHGKGASIYARPLSLLCGIPCIYTFHGVHTGKYNPVVKLLYLLIEKILGLFTSAFIAVSDSEYRVVQQTGFCSMKKVHVIPNGVCIPAQTMRDTKKKNFKILHVTRYDYPKNTALLLDIAEELKRLHPEPGVSFVLVGDGGERLLIEAEIVARGLSGYVSAAGATTEMHACYAESDIILSTSRWEGMPLSVLEAMADGVVPVLTAVTGNKDIVEHGLDGYLYSETNPSEAAMLIDSLIVNPSLLERLSINARSKAASQYNVTKMAQKTAQLYSQITGNSND